MALVLLSFGTKEDPIELPIGVDVHNHRTVILPVIVGIEGREKLKQIRLFVSDDRGRTWIHEGDYDAATVEVTFHAPDDGLYWFGIQKVLKDGTQVPEAP